MYKPQNAAYFEAVATVKTNSISFANYLVSGFYIIFSVHLHRIRYLFDLWIGSWFLWCMHLRNGTETCWRHFNHSECVA